MPALGYKIWPILIFATTGNYLGALTNYYMGKWGSGFLFTRYIQIEPEKLQQAQCLFGRWGTPILFLSWVPIIGDPLTIVGGLLNVDLRLFTFWVVLGKALRYVFILVLADLIFG
jgi:membrane protein YqaA with SNARE-associated domain